MRTEYHEDVRRAAAWALGQMKGVDAARKTLEKALTSIAGALNSPTTSMAV